MSQNQQTPPSQSPQSDDPLASLHRMSTTAGVASQEYVAINLPCVAALLLGLASVMMLMSTVMLVVPILAIIVGIVAIRQVNNSNGTQTGRTMAALGMLIAVGVVGFVGVREFQANRALEAERGKVFAAVDVFGKTLVTSDYGNAAGHFSPGFFTKKKIDPKTFGERWQHLVGTGLYGDLKSVETNGRVNLMGEPSETAGRFAETLLLFHFSKADTPMRRNAVLRKDEAGQWKIDDIPDLFPAPQESAPDASALPNAMPR